MLRPGKPSGPRSACTLAVTLLERLKRARLWHRERWEAQRHSQYTMQKSFYNASSCILLLRQASNNYSRSWVDYVFFYMTHRRSNVMLVDSVFTMPRVGTSPFLHPLPSEKGWLMHRFFFPLSQATVSLDVCKWWGTLLIGAISRATRSVHVGLCETVTACMHGRNSYKQCRLYWELDEDALLIWLIMLIVEKKGHSWNKLFLGSSCDVWLIAEWSHKIKIRRQP